MNEHTFFCKRKRYYLLGILFFILINVSTLSLNAQNVPIRGVVVDETGLPIIGATVVGTGTTIGSITDVDGNFQLSLPSDIGTLTVSSIGYTTVTVPVTRERLQITLKEAISELSTVVVVGYGSQKKETLTGSIAVVDKEALIQSPTANISNALVGRTPGLISTQSSGEAGNDAATIRIRGLATLNESGHEPLVVIDGIQSTMATMNALDANEIENISVLKDASSTAVYGVRGANGVVIVTTKRGSVAKPSINFSYRFGLTQVVSKLKMLDSYNYALYRNEAIHTDKDPGKASYLFDDTELWKFQYNRDYTPDEVELMNISQAQKEQLLNSPALYYSSHDYIEEQFGGTSPQHQYNINVSGGGERIKYFFSLGNFRQDGMFNTQYRGSNVNSQYNRNNLRSNIDIDFHKNLKVSFDFGGQFATKSGILGGASDGDVTSDYTRHKAMMVTILTNTPFVGPGIIDGNLVSSYVAIGSPLQSKGGYGYSPETFLLTRDVLTSNTSNLNTTIRIEHLMDYLTEGLSVSGAVSYNDLYRKGIVTQNSVPTYSVYRNPDNPNELVFAGGIENPKTIEDNRYNNKWNQLYVEGKANYVKSVGAHNLTAMLVLNAQKTFDPSLQFKVPSSLLGLASRITYRYDDRYLAEFNMGYNGSENFPDGKRFGFFPAFSLGWIATNEQFFPKNDILTWLKIRGSFGEVGNDKIGGRRFMYLPNTWGYLSQSSGNGYYWGSTDGTAHDPYYDGAYESSVGNPNVTWERARKSNVGVDVNFFKDRLTFVGDLFLEKRNNILWNLGTVPGIVASTLPPVNIGKVSNKGFEIQVHWGDRVLGNDLYYGIGFNMSYARNKIEYMDEPEYMYEWMNTTGFSLGQYKGYRTAGFYNNQDEASNRPYVSIDGNKVQAGDFRYIDIDGDGKIDANDRTPIGYANLPRYVFGGNIDFQYKGFSLALLFTGSLKGSMPMTSFYILNPFYMNNGAAFDFQYDNRWTPEKAAQGTEATFPRASMRTYDTQNGAPNDMWLKPTHFLRLKNVELGYNFTNLGKLREYGLSGIRVFVNGNNLLTWFSKLPSGFDPEQQDSSGASSGYLYPPTRTYNAGFSIQF